MVDDGERALWRAADLLACRGARPERFDRVVVAVDPPIISHGDACGIVVVGRRDGRGYVIEDASVCAGSGRRSGPQYVAADDAAISG